MHTHKWVEKNGKTESLIGPRVARRVLQIANESTVHAAQEGDDPSSHIEAESEVIVGGQYLADPHGHGNQTANRRAKQASGSSDSVLGLTLVPSQYREAERGKGKENCEQAERLASLHSGGRAATVGRAAGGSYARLKEATVFSNRAAKHAHADAVPIGRSHGDDEEQARQRGPERDAGQMNSASAHHGC